MIFNTQLLFFFSALGAFNGLMMGLYFLFYAKPAHISNRFLGGLLIILSIRTGKSVVFYFNPDLAFIYLQIGLSACFFIGPFLYFYIKSVTHPQSNINTVWKWHLLVLIPFITVVGYIYPFESHYFLWRPYFINGIYFQWLIYTVASGILMKEIIAKIFKQNEKLKSIEIWILSVFIGNTLVLMAYISFSYTYYIVGALSFSFIIYLLVLLLLFNKKKHSILYKSATKYDEKKISPKDAQLLISKLDTVMKEEELFKNTDLKLPELAAKIDISAHLLSQLLNDNLGKNFPSLITEYRINDAKKMLILNDKYTLEAIGNECGFKSKSAFYSAFKKHMNTTPSKYIEQQKSTAL